jgi:hypothetical protein
MSMLLSRSVHVLVDSRGYELLCKQANLGNIGTECFSHGVASERL